MYIRLISIGIFGIVVIGILLVSLRFLVKPVFDQRGRVEVSAFFIEREATLTELPTHETFRPYLVGLARNENVPTVFLRGFPIVGHRLKRGDATIISYRKYIDLGGMGTDRSLYEKLTIFLPPEVAIDGSGNIDITSAEDILAFWSRGSSDFPHNAPCVGYADRGRIKYSRSSDDWVYMSIELSIGFVDITEANCRPFAYSEEWMFERRDVDSLTPWEGTATGDDGYLEGYPPN